MERKRWTGKVTAFFGDLPKSINRSRSRHPGKPDAELYRYFLEDHEAGRGSRAGSLIHAAVCRAFLKGRLGYLDELSDSNPPELSM